VDRVDSGAAASNQRRRRRRTKLHLLLQPVVAERRIGGDRKTRVTRGGRVLLDRRGIAAAAAVPEGEGAEPEPRLSELHIFSGFGDVNDESGIDIFDR